jgi:Nucleotide modification associated domain 3
MSTGLLIRVGIDSTSGGWNAPCLDKGPFCYVPMGSSKHLTRNYDPKYAAFRDFVGHLHRPYGDDLPCRCAWPERLPREGHLDPDFRQCTYGDGGTRAKRIWDVLRDADDPFIVFYAGMRSVDSGDLVYSIIGFYSVHRILRTRQVAKRDWHRNFHTQTSLRRDSNDVVVLASKKDSGRLYHHISIGGLRGRHYRVYRSLLREWRGLDVKNGYIHRSGFLPRFEDPRRSLRWFRCQKPQLIHADNPRYNGA